MTEKNYFTYENLQFIFLTKNNWNGSEQFNVSKCLLALLILIIYLIIENIGGGGGGDHCQIFFLIFHDFI